MNVAMLRWLMKLRSSTSLFLDRSDGSFCYFIFVLVPQIASIGWKHVYKWWWRTMCRRRKNYIGNCKIPMASRYVAQKTPSTVRSVWNEVGPRTFSKWGTEGCRSCNENILKITWLQLTEGPIESASFCPMIVLESNGRGNRLVHVFPQAFGIMFQTDPWTIS